MLNYLLSISFAENIFMRHFFSLLLGLILLPFYSFSQMTITAGDFGDIGLEVNYVGGIGLGNFDFSGENQTWDMSDLNGTSTAVSYISVEGTPEETLYPEANMVELAGSYNYIKKTSESIQLLGRLIEGQITGQFSDPIDYIRFPFNYLDSYEDEFSAESTIIPSKTAVTEEGRITVTYDGFGLLQLPFDTIEVARIKSISENDQITNGDTAEVYSIAYSWFSPEFNHLVATYNEIYLDDELLAASHSYLDEQSFNSIREYTSALKVTVYPNPASEFLYLSSDEKIVKLEILNNLGELLLVEEESFSKIDLSNLATQNYFIKILTRNGWETQVFSKY